MTKGNRKLIKLLLTTACFSWVAVSGWILFSDLPEDAVQTHKSDAVKDKMRECEGSFQQRYDCKETIVIQSGRKTFWNMTERLLIICIPAIFVGILGGAIIRRIPGEPIAVQAAEVDWKQRAQHHITHPDADTHQG